MEESTGVVDPVCGMTVDPESAEASRTFAGDTYWFCCPACAKVFDKYPARYAMAATTTPDAAAI